MWAALSDIVAAATENRYRIGEPLTYLGRVALRLGEEDLRKIAAIQIAFGCGKSTAIRILIRHSNPPVMVNTDGLFIDTPPPSLPME